MKRKKEGAKWNWSTYRPGPIIGYSLGCTCIGRLCTSECCACMVQQAPVSQQAYAMHVHVCERLLCMHPCAGR